MLCSPTLWSERVKLGSFMSQGCNVFKEMNKIAWCTSKIKTYYFSAVLLPSPLPLVLLSSRNSATKKVHGDVTSLFSFLLCYPLSVQCVLQWSYLCDLASLRSFQSPLGLQHYSRGRRRRSTAMTKFNFKFFFAYLHKIDTAERFIALFFTKEALRWCYTGRFATTILSAI